ncbi:carotenoid biosynthesis protein [Stygiolobus caldivivus]|uniref:Carotenoid biosynthesis protein n=1 Tax=Stygiolobus caldivivus TaxID=2824673 RepID=A0A8D5ZIJ0_9CREN|nr:carotenoid biosynthesis protein [Stygiolobus caldivivus]BCU69661.1 hypothetical protein KN1_09580 [Stygiolobus caldivivus]
MVKWDINKVQLASLIILVLGIILDGILIVFFFLSVISLILISMKRRDAITVFLVSMIVGFLSEELGIHTGIPFGRYEYNFPPYILGVPIFVILGWGLFSFISYLAIMDFPKRYKVAFFPLMMVIIDLSVDPIMVTAHFWTWAPSPLEWFGIPVTNFLGWYLVSLIISLTFPNRAYHDRPNPLFIIPYFLFSLKFLLFAEPQLFVPLLVATSLAGLTSIVLYMAENRINAKSV